MATYGLGSNNMAAIYGAFLVSHLMRPIIQSVFAVVEWLHHQQQMDAEVEGLFGGSLFHAFTSFVVALMVSYAIGFVGSMYMMWRTYDSVNDWPTAEMEGRTQTKNNENNFYVAVFCGIGLGNGLIDGFRNTMGTDLVGVGIAASLLPPLCNTGMLTALYVNNRYSLGFRGYGGMDKDSS